MARIVQLDKHVAELIAAGEVVERPASAVKELVENAIDAGATAITVEIRRGGAGYIRVTDNGSGIENEDVPTAFLRNATSKVRTEEDLHGIATLGFRGEALASICAVAKVTMTTRTARTELGTKIELAGGEVARIEEAGCPVGTTIVVRDLFYNTPARLKFLKSDVTEANAVAACMDRMALSHVEIAFKFIRDGKIAMFSSGNSDLLSCAYSVFGKEFAQGLVPVQYTLDQVTVRGLVSKPEATRGSRSMQYFFVNGRFIKTATGQTALEEAYKNEIMARKFPACILFIDLDCRQVDVNTHPAKIEIRFVQEKPVYEAIFFGVKNALMTVTPIPTVRLEPSPQAVIMKNEAIQSAGEQMKISSKSSESSDIQIRVEPVLQASPQKPAIAPEDDFWRRGSLKVAQSENQYHRNVAGMLDAWAPAEETDAGPEEMPPQLPVEQEEMHAEPVISQDFRLIGEAFATFILAESGDGLYLVDKHAAHERILFEQLKKGEGAGQSQVLLSPIPVALPKNEYALVLENSLEIAKMGIMIDDFGQGTVLVREFPTALDKGNIREIVEEIAALLVKGKKGITPALLDELYHSMACKAAVKGNSKSSEQELISLLQMLADNGEIRHCPHGRPVAVELTKKEIEKQFGRIQ